MSISAYVKISGLSGGKPIPAKYRAADGKRSLFIRTDEGSRIVELNGGKMRVITHAEGSSYYLDVDPASQTALTVEINGQVLTAQVVTSRLTVTDRDGGFTVYAEYTIADEPNVITIDCELGN